MKKIINFIFSKINSGHSRSITVKKNILGSIFVKGGSVIIGFIQVPIILNYLNQEHYGIWITLASFLGWFTFFDIGLGAGLRNKLAEAIAENDKVLARKYVSTGYFSLILIFSIIAIIFLIISPLLDWSKIVNSSKNLQYELFVLSIIIFELFFVRFVLQLITPILLAHQKTALSNSIEPLAKLLTLIAIIIVTNITNKGNLIMLGTLLSIPPIIVYFSFSLFLFTKKFAYIRPSIRYVERKYIKLLLSIGVQFFFIKITGLILFQTSRFIIAHYFGPTQVTSYHIAHKYFSVVALLFTMALTPIWSAHTEAFARNDIKWIRNITKKMLNLWTLFAIFTFFMLIIANRVYSLWVGDKVVIPFTLSLTLAIYFVLFNFGGIFNMFINGVGKIRLQIVCGIIASIMFIPLTMFFIKVCKMGIISVVLAMIIANFFGPIFAPIQFYKIINKTAKGIWN